jgi:hypothetical protein
MAVPWLRLLNAVLGINEVVRVVKGRSAAAAAADDPEQLAVSERGGPLEVRLAGVVVAALKEAFDRDHQRLELEREQIEAERMRTERLLRIELARQAGDQEIGRLRLLAGVAMASWLGTLFFSARLVGGASGGRVALGVGWLLLLAALSASFVAQAAVTRGLNRTDAREFASSGTAGALAPWLLVSGLAVIGLGVLLA